MCLPPPLQPLFWSAPKTQTHRLAWLQPHVPGGETSPASSATFRPSFWDGQTPARVNPTGSQEEVVQESVRGTRVSFCPAIALSPWEHPQQTSRCLAGAAGPAVALLPRGICRPCSSFLQTCSKQCLGTASKEKHSFALAGPGVVVRQQPELAAGQPSR